MPIVRAAAINYRSEPFGINNMHVQHEYFGFEDESMGYSSYTFGDPSRRFRVRTWEIPPNSGWFMAARKCSTATIRTAAPFDGHAARGRSMT